MKLRSFMKTSGVDDLVPTGGLLGGLVHSQGASVVEFVDESRGRSGRVVDLKLRSDLAMSEPGGKHQGLLLATKGLQVQMRKANTVVGLRLVEIPGGRSGRKGVVATVAGDLDVHLGDLGLVEIGRTTVGGGRAKAVIASYGRASGILGMTHDYFALRLGSSILVIDDEAETVAPSVPLPLTGRVYRLASTGLLMTFDSVMFTATPDRTDVSLRGGQIVSLA